MTLAYTDSGGPGFTIICLHAIGHGARDFEDLTRRMAFGLPDNCDRFSRPGKFRERFAVGERDSLTHISRKASWIISRFVRRFCLEIRLAVPPRFATHTRIQIEYRLSYYATVEVCKLRVQLAVSSSVLLSSSLLRDGEEPRGISGPSTNTTKGS